MSSGYTQLAYGDLAYVVFLGEDGSITVLGTPSDEEILSTGITLGLPRHALSSLLENREVWCYGIMIDVPKFIEGNKET